MDFVPAVVRRFSLTSSKRRKPPHRQSSKPRRVVPVAAETAPQSRRGSTEFVRRLLRVFHGGILAYPHPVSPPVGGPARLVPRLPPSIAPARSREYLVVLQSTLRFSSVSDTIVEAFVVSASSTGASSRIPTPSRPPWEALLITLARPLPPCLPQLPVRETPGTAGRLCGWVEEKRKKGQCGPRLRRDPPDLLSVLMGIPPRSSSVALESIRSPCEGPSPSWSGKNGSSTRRLPRVWLPACP